MDNLQVSDPRGIYWSCHDVLFLRYLKKIVTVDDAKWSFLLSSKTSTSVDPRRNLAPTKKQPQWHRGTKKAPACSLNMTAAEATLGQTEKSKGMNSLSTVAPAGVRRGRSFLQTPQCAPSRLPGNLLSTLGHRRKMCGPGYEDACHAERGRSIWLPFLKDITPKPSPLSSSSGLRRQAWNQSTCWARQAHHHPQQGSKLPSHLALVWPPREEP